MALIFYVIDENGEYSSQDGKVKYRKLVGSEIFYFFRSEDSKGKRFYIDEGVAFEVPKSKEKIITSHNSRKYYVNKTQKDSKMEIIHMYAQSGDDDINADEVLSSSSEDMWLRVLHNLIVEDLYQGIETLTKEEQYIIKALYLDFPLKKQREIAEELGVSQQFVSKKLKSAKKKLKIFLEKWL